MDWLGDLWQWALGNGIPGVMIAGLVTAFIVLIAGNVVVWTLAGIKFVCVACAEGYQRARSAEDRTKV